MPQTSCGIIQGLIFELGKYQVDTSAYPTLNLIAKEETIYLGDIPAAVLMGQANYDSNGDYLGTQQVLYYVHADHLNTPRRLTRPADNALMWRWDSDPFGSGYPNGHPSGGTTWVTYSARFPGQVYDLYSGLYYNYARDYDPSTGRYLESDPIGLQGGINTYAYAKDRPDMLIDPTGLFTMTEGVTYRDVSKIPGGQENQGGGTNPSLSVQCECTDCGVDGS